MNAVFAPLAELLVELDLLTAALAPLNGAKLHLYKTDISLGPATVLGDFVEADFTGYAASGAVTWGSAFIAPDGTPTVAADLQTFTAGSPFITTNTVYGWYLTDGAGTTLLRMRRFDTPVQVTQAGQAVQVVPTTPAFLPE